MGVIRRCSSLNYFHGQESCGNLLLACRSQYQRLCVIDTIVDIGGGHGRCRGVKCENGGLTQLVRQKAIRTQGLLHGGRISSIVQKLKNKAHVMAGATGTSLRMTTATAF